MLRRWFRAPYRVTTLVLLMLVISAVLLAFAWRQLHEDHEREQKQMDVRREQATDVLVAALERVIGATEETLRDAQTIRSAAATPDSITVVMQEMQLEAFPHGRLLYYPVGAPGPVGSRDAVPTELFERWARCRQIAALGQTSQLRTEALELRELLLDSRWSITRPVFEKHFQAASAWANAGEPPANHRLALSEAVDRLWSASAGQAFRAAGEPQNGAKEGRAGRRWTMTAGGVQFTVLSQTVGNRVGILIAGPGYVQREWKARISELEDRHRVRLAVHDATTGATSAMSRRTAAETGLPWTITVRAIGDEMVRQP